MRRITLWFLSTVSALVLLFSYHTSTDPDGSAAAEGQGSGDGHGGDGTTQPAPPAPPMPGTAAPRPGQPTAATPAAPVTPATGLPTMEPLPEGGGTARPGGPATAAPGTPGRAGDTTARTVIGPAVRMKYGPIQVQVIVAGGRVVGVHAISWPTANHVDVKINSAAIPKLDAAATAAGSASIDLVSGATYTSHAYQASLQAALDQAHL